MKIGNGIVLLKWLHTDGQARQPVERKMKGFINIDKVTIDKINCMRKFISKMYLCTETCYLCVWVCVFSMGRRDAWAGT